MAGTNKSYHRTSNMSSTTKTATNSTGNQENYKQFDFYLYGPGDQQYYAQGPERANQSTVTKSRVNSLGKLEEYKVWNGTAGAQ